MSDNSTLPPNRPRSAKRRRLVIVILVVVVALAIRYRREIYVYAMIDCGGLYLNIMATPNVLEVNRELLDENLAQAGSEANEIEILRNNLQHRHQWVCSHALRYIESHRERLVPQFSSESIGILEQRFGGEALSAKALLRDLPTVTAPESQRLIDLAQRGDPGWRQDAALMLMRVHRSFFLEADLRHVGIDLAIMSDDFCVRESAVLLLQSLDEPLVFEDVLRLVESEHKEPQMAGLRFLVTSEHDSTVEYAKSLFGRGHPETKQFALSILAERDADFARDTAQQSLSSMDTSISATALLTLRSLGKVVPLDQETKIIETLETDIVSFRLVGHQRMRRLWIMYELDADRAVGCARKMIREKQLGSLPVNFLKTVGEERSADEL